MLSSCCLGQATASQGETLYSIHFENDVREIEYVPPPDQPVSRRLRDWLILGVGHSWLVPDRSVNLYEPKDL